MTNINDTLQAPAEPGSGDRIVLGDVLGNLLLITVDKMVSDVETEYGTTDAIAASVAVLDGSLKGTVYDDTLIFSRGLQSQIKTFVGGGKVVGRLTQGEKKPGKNPAWLLDRPTEDDLATARKYLEYVASQAATDDRPF